MSKRQRLSARRSAGSIMKTALKSCCNRHVCLVDANVMTPPKTVGGANGPVAAS